MQSTMTRNTELFNIVAEKVKQERGHHYNQMKYGAPANKKTQFGDTEPTLCQSAFCIAGHAGIELGWRPIWAHNICAGWHIEGWRNPNGDWAGAVELHHTAAKALGLREPEAAILFGSSWKPKSRLTVEKALVKLGEGATVDSVSRYM